MKRQRNCAKLIHLLPPPTPTPHPSGVFLSVVKEGWAMGWSGFVWLFGLKSQTEVQQVEQGERLNMHRLYSIPTDPISPEKTTTKQ